MVEEMSWFKDKIKQWEDSNDVGWLKAQLESLADELVSEKEKNLRIVRGEFGQICSHCGWESPTEGASWEELQEHINTCEKHPLFALRAERDALELELAAAREALEPFALAADCATCPGTIPPEKVVLWCQSSTTLGPKGEITVADVRRAKMFLSSFSPSAVSNIEAVLKSAK
jgi:hypothetical protein